MPQIVAWRRLAFGATALALLLGPTTVQADDAGVRRGYDGARRCMVVNLFIANRFKTAGDTANAALFNTKGEEAHKVSYLYGDMLRLSRADIARDLDAASQAELPKLLGDAAYVTQSVAFCKAQGLI